jgi:aryl-alcohol dehydrogenase-like predicted oxidoreductase
VTLVPRAMQERRLGSDGPLVSAIGLGCMPMSGTYGIADEREAIATIHRALDEGITLLDTADVYGLGHNERLVGRAIADRRDAVVIATKFGNVFDEADGRAGRVSGEPAYVRLACEASLRRLGVDTIDLYQQHRVDLETPIEETVGALAELVEEGKIRFIGLSEAVPDDIRRAAAVHPIASVQSEYSVLERGVERDVLATCDELGIGFLAFAPFMRGLLSGSLSADRELEPDDKRGTDRTYPRVGPTHRAANARLAAEVQAIGDAHDATMAQVALAWLLTRRPYLVPIPGTKHPSYVEQNAHAIELSLTDEDLAALDSLASRVSGERYGAERPQPGRASPPAAG